MAFVKCPACRRFIRSEDLSPLGDCCELCQSPPAAPSPPSRVLAEPEPEEVNVALAAEEDGGWKSFPGRVIASTGVGLMVLGACASLAGVQAGARASKGSEWSVVAACFVGGCFLGVVGGAAFGVGKRMAARSADQVEAADGRPPVLLLRRFQDDAIDFGTRPTNDPIAAYMPDERQTFEERVAEAASVAGPVVAIGDPAEGLPKLGAARMYVGNDAWKARVSEYLGRAGLVVMIMSRIDGEHGLAWELRTVWAAVPPERVVFVVPPVTEDEARRRWTDFQERCGGRLPAYQGNELAAGFDPDGTCRVVRAAGDRKDLVEDYAAAVRRFAGAVAARQAAEPIGEVVLEVVAPAPSVLGRLGRRFSLGSFKTVAVLFLLAQLSCVSGSVVGRTDLALTWQLPGWRVYAAQVPLIVGAAATGAMALAFVAALEKRVKRFEPTNLIFFLPCLVMIVSWLGAGALTARLVYAIVTGKPGAAEPTTRPRIEGARGPDTRQATAEFEFVAGETRAVDFSVPDAIIRQLDPRPGERFEVRLRRTGEEAVLFRTTTPLWSANAKPLFGTTFGELSLARVVEPGDRLRVEIRRLVP